MKITVINGTEKHGITYRIFTFLQISRPYFVVKRDL